jgi:hypothetical protein
MDLKFSFNSNFCSIQIFVQAIYFCSIQIFVQFKLQYSGNSGPETGGRCCKKSINCRGRSIVGRSIVGWRIDSRSIVSRSIVCWSIVGRSIEVVPVERHLRPFHRHVHQVLASRSHAFFTFHPCLLFLAITHTVAESSIMNIGYVQSWIARLFLVQRTKTGKKLT